MRKHVTTAIAGIAMTAILATSSWAEGIASQAKSLRGLSDRQCVRKVDRVIDREHQNAPHLRRVVVAEFTRRVVYNDGTVDFACFPNLVVVTVYFSNAGERRAERDLRNFLKAF